MSGPRGRILPCVIAAVVAIPGTAVAHEVRPAYLEMRETSPGRFDVLFKTPLFGGLRLDLRPVLPASCRTLTATSTRLTPSASIERWIVACDPGPGGGRIAVRGLEGLLLDVLVRIETLDGRARTLRLRPVAPEQEIPTDPTAGQVAGAYLLLGVEHILGGVDHLLFVLALLLIVRGGWRLLQTITSFTVAHSITLGLATLGAVTVPRPPVEAVISLSVVFLAAELTRLKQGRSGLTARAPWIVAFTFGLLHGLGFAGALADVGLPQRHIPLALLQFNVGVEVGQVLFVAAVMGLASLGRRVPVAWPPWAWRVPPYAIGSIAAFWTVQRVVGYWPMSLP